MRKILVTACLLLTGISSAVLFAHNSTVKSYYKVQPYKDTLPADKDKVIPVLHKDTPALGKVEEEAHFLGGDEGWRNFMMTNLNPDAPVKNGAPAGKYTVIVQFIVDTTGNVSDVRALTQNGYGMEKEVIRILHLSPKWEPAQQNGHSVKAYRKQPITFEVAEEKKKRKLF